MRDPTRLLNSAVSESEFRLLRAGSLEEPPPEALQRLAATLGVRPSAVELPAPGTGNPAAAARVATLGSKLSSGVIAGSAAGAALLLGATLWLATRSTDAGPAPAPAAHRAVESRLPAAETPGSGADPAPAVAAQPAQTVAGDVLAEEIARLDAIRHLLAANRLAPALSALQSYERDYAGGSLRQEATLLRIEALQRAGRRAEARVLAERYLADNPDSPHGPRIRALVYGSRNVR